MKDLNKLLEEKADGGRKLAVVSVPDGLSEETLDTIEKGGRWSLVSVYGRVTGVPYHLKELNFIFRKIDR